MAYLTLAAPADAEIEIRKSRFHAFAFPITDREQALQEVNALKARYPDARHHCWAYLLGNPAGSASAGMDDNGEPAGTAGRPILNVLQHKKVGDTLIVVVRWFGGIKLGAGGLTRAYSQAAQSVLDHAELVERAPMQRLHIALPFSDEHALRHLLAQYGGTLDTLTYESQGIAAEVSLPESSGSQAEWPHTWQITPV
ncbi:uncharacterized protein, YigZ family [Sulfurivirga caldicuralii]|uniref:Uncharacterized protein, YigZ family n=1 Tax=Sulfurivirga caldicuralii TaxID=364032 RepID=A0A1N6GMV3_9GAMM|nr:YigZ family protein [Sulfurivirga caldicuralii]SIO08879.1 uncharacterized protein, YigZ family [Sulfurivirga caldicuralii]